METDRFAAFERERRHLLSVAFRILGSQSDAEDVVQETWLRYDRSDTAGIKNLTAWLTTIASRLCVDLLRRRRRGVLSEDPEFDVTPGTSANDPEQAALLASELAVAFTIVLEELTPHQRVALILHDAFGVPFEDIAPILGTSIVSAKKFASRARERVRRRTAGEPVDTAKAQQVVEAFLQAAQDGNTNRLLALLDPNVIRTADPQVLPPRGAQRVDGVQAVLGDTARFRSVAVRARVGQIDGRPGIVVFSGAALQLALAFRIVGGRVVQFDVIADPNRLAVLEVS